jgi:hypothetical protein
MKRIDRKTVSFAAAIAALAMVIAAPAAAQDYTVHMKTDDASTTTYVSRNAIRVTDTQFGTDLIYRLAEDKFIDVRHKDKAYQVATLAQIREANQKVSAQMDAEQKKAMQRMGLDTWPGITKLGAGETIAGYATERYVSRTPMMEVEVWAAPALKVPQAYYDIFSSGAGRTGAFGSLARFGDAGRTVNGMILKRVVKMGGVTMTKVATAVDTAPIPASTFEPPAGYTMVRKEL